VQRHNIIYRGDIDGLRTIAVLLVVFFHGFPSLGMGGGFVGVDVFFVISGFLISGIIFQDLEDGSFTFTQFYERRIRRIFPALSIVLSAALLLGWMFLIPDEFSRLGTHVIAGAGFVSNFLLWYEVGYFNPASDSKPLLHLWSLGIEEQFYIFLPLILLILWQKKNRLLFSIVVIVACSFLLNVIGVYRDLSAAFYSPFTRM
jgi:peptidoglycan/LPS O-acetylase OafA/YrhL